MAAGADREEQRGCQAGLDDVAGPLGLDPVVAQDQLPKRRLHLAGGGRGWAGAGGGAEGRGEKGIIQERCSRKKFAPHMTRTAGCAAGGGHWDILRRRGAANGSPFHSTLNRLPA